MIRVLWLAPVFNHYKARFLNHLANHQDIKLAVFSGSGRQDQGDGSIEGNWEFNHISCRVSKQKFGFSSIVRKKLKEHFEHYDWVLIPAEKKNGLLLLYACWLRFRSRNKVKIFSYNHPVLKSKRETVTFKDRFLTRIFYKLYDRVIFYTEQSCEQAVAQKLIKPSKAFWANNTLDNHEIEKHFQFRYPPGDDLRMLFIGRLIPSKKIGLLLDYYEELKKRLKIDHDRELELEIIGDGPQNSLVKEKLYEYESIIWHGTLIDEDKIAPVMERCSLVFIPGLSGLSINHAFMYGRPYITLQSGNHGPEINYLEGNKDGLILGGSFSDNVDELLSLLTDRDRLEAYCEAAYQKGQELSIGNWTGQMVKALSS